MFLLIAIASSSNNAFCPRGDKAKNILRELNSIKPNPNHTIPLGMLTFKHGLELQIKKLNERSVNREEELNNITKELCRLFEGYKMILQLRAYPKTPDIRRSTPEEAN
jgi:hypothetical protein